VYLSRKLRALADANVPETFANPRKSNSAFKTSYLLPISWHSACIHMPPRAALASGGFVKTRIQSLSLLATLAIALGMIVMGGTLHAQNSPSSSPDRQAQQPSQSPDTTQTPPPQSQDPSSSQSPSSQTPSQTPDTNRTPDTTPQSGAANGTGTDSQVFSGTVVKTGDKYVLKDDSGHTYDIDHQDEVKKFEGKRVRVQGTLDAATNKIMVK
jgi:hypothetical protein